MIPRVMRTRARRLFIKVTFELLILSMCTAAMPVPSPPPVLSTATENKLGNRSSPIVRLKNNDAVSISAAPLHTETINVERKVIVQTQHDSIPSISSHDEEKKGQNEPPVEIVPQPFRDTRRVVVERQFPKSTRASPPENQNSLSRLSLLSFVRPSMSISAKEEKDNSRTRSTWKSLTQVLYKSGPLKGTEGRDRRALGLENPQGTSTNSSVSSNSRETLSATQRNGTTPLPIAFDSIEVAVSPQALNQTGIFGNYTSLENDSESQRKNSSAQFQEIPDIKSNQVNTSTDELRKSLKAVISEIKRTLGDLISVGLKKIRGSSLFHTDQGYEEKDVAFITGAEMQDMAMKNRNIAVHKNANITNVTTTLTMNVSKFQENTQEAAKLSNGEVEKEKILNSAEKTISGLNMNSSRKSTAKLLNDVGEEVEKHFKLAQGSRV